MAESRRLPDGSLTRDAVLYIDTWKVLARPIEEALGWRLHSCDSGLVFLMESGTLTTVSVELAQLVKDLITDQGGLK